MYQSGEVGRRIRRLRQARGLTAAELGRRAGITENAVRKLEAGDSREPRFSTGLRIAQILHVDPTQLMPVERDDEGAPTLANVVGTLRSMRSKLAELGVAHAAVFGSVARGDAHGESDVDVIIDPKSGTRFSLVGIGRAQELLERALGHRVDIFVRNTIAQSQFAEQALREAVDAF